MVVEKKKTPGSRKIEMKKIERLNNRQVTFSKRRVGLFKKASDICVQSGVEIVIIVQSLAGKRVCVDSVIDQFENRITSLKDYAQTLDFKRDYYVVFTELEAKKRDEVNDGSGFWWDMEVEDLEMFKAALEGELKNLKTKAEYSSSSLITGG